MEEILYELKDHSAGLNCGRWDYIFSFIKKFKNNSNYVLPDRSEVTMKRHFLSSYVKQLVYVCHKRGVHAMGGMAAQIPIKNDSDANEKGMSLIKNDKERDKIYHQVIDEKSLVVYKENFKIIHKKISYDDFVKLASEK